MRFLTARITNPQSKRVHVNHKTSLMTSAFVKGLTEFVDYCKTPYNFSVWSRNCLTKSGYQELFEDNLPEHFPDRGFIIRDGKALVAYDIGGFESLFITGSHCDSPVMKLSQQREPKSGTVDCALYGGGLGFTYMGRNLTVAGAVAVREEDGLSIRVVNGNEPIAFLQPEGSEVSVFKYKVDASKPMTHEGEDKSVRKYVADLLGVSPSDVPADELAFVDSKPASVFSDLICSPRLDNLSSAYACLKGFLDSKAKGSLNICAVFDVEEVGSRSRTGALSHLLGDTIAAICKDRGVDSQSLIKRGLFCSVDVAHGWHPNYSKDRYRVALGSGVVVKVAFGRSYSYDEIGLSLLKEASRRSGHPIVVTGKVNSQSGGGTIGPKVEALLQIRSVDLGACLLGMHGYREMMSCSDIEHECGLMAYLYDNFGELYKWAFSS